MPERKRFLLLMSSLIGSNALYDLLPQVLFLKLDLVVALLSEMFAIKH